MPLSEEELRLLEQMERALVAEDPAPTLAVPGHDDAALRGALAPPPRPERLLTTSLGTPGFRTTSLTRPSLRDGCDCLTAARSCPSGRPSVGCARSRAWSSDA